MRDHRTYQERMAAAQAKDLSKQQFGDVYDACAISTLGATFLRKWAKEIGAERRIGRRSVYDLDVIRNNLKGTSGGEQYD